MTIELFTPAQFTAMPWKNGGGSTLELFKEPSEGVFTWRLSMASILASGPFSVFDGYERFITALSGAPVIINIDGEEHPLKPLLPFRFDGERSSSCTLLGEKAIDFNLFVAKDFGDGSCSVIRDDTLIGANPRRKRMALYAYQGDGSVIVDEEALDIRENELLIFKDVVDVVEIACSGVWIQAEICSFLV